METAPRIDDIRAAQARIAPYVHRTQVMRSGSLDTRVGVSVFLKCEHLQRVGAFKARGAMNSVLMLPVGVKAVATHSSGNHAAALARAAAVCGLQAHIVMPTSAPLIKQAAVAGYGGSIEYCEPTLEAREAALRRLVTRTGAEVVHPYNDWRVIEGQGTAALELLEEVPDLDVVIVPVGGGGLLAGTAVAVKGLHPADKVIGVEPAAADDAARGFRSGIRVTGTRPQTIADGLRAELGERNFEVIRVLVDDIITVSEESIVAAMRFIWERTKQIIEPSAATVVAALMDGHAALGGQRIGAILSGGNVDLDALSWRE